MFLTKYNAKAKIYWPNTAIQLTQLFKNMQKALLESESLSDLKLLLELAKKIGIKSKILSADGIEEIGIANAIKIGRTDEYIDTNEFLKKISQ